MAGVEEAVLALFLALGLHAERVTISTYTAGDSTYYRVQAGDKLHRFVRRTKR